MLSSFSPAAGHLTVKWFNSIRHSDNGGLIFASALLSISSNSKKFYRVIENILTFMMEKITIEKVYFNALCGYSGFRCHSYGSREKERHYEADVIE